MEDIYHPKPRRGLAGMLLNCLSFVFVLAALVSASGIAVSFESSPAPASQTIVTSGGNPCLAISQTAFRNSSALNRVASEVP